MLARLRRARDVLRAAQARHRRLCDPEVLLPGARRGTVHQERLHAGGALHQARRRPSALRPHRHSHREQAHRAVEHLRLPDARPSGLGGGLPRALRGAHQPRGRRRSPSPAVHGRPLHPATPQGRRAQGPSREERVRRVHGHGRRAAQALRRRGLQPREDPAPSDAAGVRHAALRHPGRAHQAAPDLLRPGHPLRQLRGRLGQARGRARPYPHGCRRRPQGAALLAVHQHALRHRQAS